MSCPAHDLADSRRLLLREDVDLIQRLALERLPGKGVVLDLGAGSGTSALAVLSVRPDAFVVSVDAKEEAIHTTEELLTNTAAQANNLPPAKCWRGVWADTCDRVPIIGAAMQCERVRDSLLGAAKGFVKGDEIPAPIMFDALQIDSSHEEAATGRELDTWLPAVRPGGYVWAHDYSVDEAALRGLDAYPGVRIAIDRAVKEGRLEAGGTEGLGWWGTVPR